ncbi:Subtilisin-like protease SBT1.4 [Sesamum alatum]|uniref:Subtilisin-like protease SBT1.4 n=1 Tax=Sesamum alatum TaxID=300844 RepID=A0AAE1XQF9_9LAMI|nr:Subtilisin-like protease SBT1.4 [Sesamum alatum]
MNRSLGEIRKATKNTHTSTVVGSTIEIASLFGYANGEARGMAVKARIAVYKICWTFGYYDSDILAIMEHAIEDGVDKISFFAGANGHAPQYDYDSIAIGAFGAAEHGIVVSCSVGNSRPVNLADSGEELLADAHFIPATIGEQTVGDKIQAYARSDPNPTATIVFEGNVISTSPPALRVASFSSRGLNYRTAEIVKLGVIAPGVVIPSGHLRPASLH